MLFFKKTFALLIILGLLFSLNPSGAWGLDFSTLLNSLGGTSDSSAAGLGQASILSSAIPSPSEATDEVLNSLGFEKAEVQKAATQFNAMSYKDDGPQVELTFAPAAPEPGKKITAFASTSFFSNTPENQYFTWFLKTAYCQKNSSACDYNKDGETDIEDYKIEAARLIASGNFEWQKELGKNDPACNSATPPEHCTLDNPAVTPPAEADDDGYAAVFGGDDQRGKNAHCFVRAPKDFKEIEKKEGHCMSKAEKEDEEIECVHLFPTYYNEETNKGIGSLKEEEVGDGKFGLEEEKFWRTDPNTNDTSASGMMDEASVTGLGKLQFSWTYSPGDKVGVAVEGASVTPTTEKDASFKTMWAITNNPEIKIENQTATEYVDPRYGSPVFHWDDDGVFFCIPLTYIPVLGGLSELDRPFLTAPPLGLRSCKVTISCGNTGDEIIQHVNSISETNGVDPGDCENYFFQYKMSEVQGSVGAGMTIVIDRKYGDDCEVSVDGKPGHHWGRIGAESFPRKTTLSDLNIALEEAFVEPTTGTDYKKITNNLSTSNSNPQYNISTEGGSSDIITLRANAVNTEEANFTDYIWSLAVAASSNGGSDEWESLDGADLGGNIQLTGIGLNSLKIPLETFSKKDAISGKTLLETKNIPIDATIFYIRATLTTKANDAGVKKEGLETMIIPVQMAQGGITLSNTIVKEDATTQNVSLVTGEDKCTEGMERTLCPVISNEIMRSSVDNKYESAEYDFSWTLDGKRLVPEEGGNVVFFPITEKTGETANLRVDIASKTSSEKISFTRSFSVVEPATVIQPAEEASTDIAPVLLGYYVDKKAKQKWPNYSKDIFQALAGKVVQLQAQNNTAATGKTTWSVDGKEVLEETTYASEPYLKTVDNVLTLHLPIEKPLGASYKVTSVTPYAPDENMQELLRDRWHVPENNLLAETLTKTVTLQVVDALNATTTTVSGKNSTKVLASLFSGLPSYISFLFKIMVTFALILFSSSLLLSLSPERKME